VEVHGVLRVVAAVWPFVSLGCAAAIALLLVGMQRLGAVIALVTSGYAGGVATWALTAHSRGLIHRADLGPATTLLASIAAFAGGLSCLATRTSKSGRVL
jgi:hypothetical protein